MNEASANELLTMAKQLLARPDAKTAGLWPRAAALLARQALETALDDFWKSKNLPFDYRCGRRHQLLCLREYMDPQKAGELSHAWSALSRACHHHPYELAPTVGELEGWMVVVGRMWVEQRT